MKPYPQMSIEEALQQMSIEKAIELNNRRFFCNADETINTIAEWAMKKQIAGKPQKDKYGHDCCPDCGWVVDTWCGDERKTPYCENCGKRLDWEERAQEE